MSKQVVDVQRYLIMCDHSWLIRSISYGTKWQWCFYNESAIELVEMHAHFECDMAELHTIYSWQHLYIPVALDYYILSILFDIKIVEYVVFLYCDFVYKPVMWFLVKSVRWFVCRAIPRITSSDVLGFHSCIFHSFISYAHNSNIQRECDASSI